MCQSRVIEKYNKKSQIFFKVQTQLSVNALAEKQKKHCAKNNLGLRTYMPKNGHVEVVSMKMSSEKWCQKHVEKS